MKRASQQQRAVRISPEYRRGRQAYRDGLVMADCPYREGDLSRHAWITGYLDARTMDRLIVVFQRFGIDWP